MSQGKLSDTKDASAATRQSNNSTRMLAKHEVIFRGEPVEITIRNKDLTFFTKFINVLNEMIFRNHYKITMKTIIARWIPNVEPGIHSSIRIMVKYHVGEDEGEMVPNDVVACVTGKISEALKIKISPTKSIIKPKDTTFHCPWSVYAELDQRSTTDDLLVLGIMRMECDLAFEKITQHARVETKQHLNPQVDWNNLHFPYYVPFFTFKRVRGIGSVLWRDTKNYKMFLDKVMMHATHAHWTEKDHLALMQVISQEDSNVISRYTENCSATKGGFCTCKGLMDSYLSSVLDNSNQTTRDHGILFDDVAKGIIRGSLKTCEDWASIMF